MFSEVLGGNRLAAADADQDHGMRRQDAAEWLYESAGGDTAERQMAAIAFAGLAGNSRTG
jgi:hypothetical protein